MRYLSFALSSDFKQALLKENQEAGNKYQDDELLKEVTRIKLRKNSVGVLNIDFFKGLMMCYHDVQVWHTLEVFFFINLRNSLQEIIFIPAVLLDGGKQAAKWRGHCVTNVLWWKYWRFCSSPRSLKQNLLESITQ